MNAKKVSAQSENYERLIECVALADAFIIRSNQRVEKMPKKFTYRYKDELEYAAKVLNSLKKQAESVDKEEAALSLSVVESLQHMRDVLSRVSSSGPNIYDDDSLAIFRFSERYHESLGKVMQDHFRRRHETGD